MTHRKFPRPELLLSEVIYHNDRRPPAEWNRPIVSLEASGLKYWRVSIDFKQCSVSLRAWWICIKIAESFSFDRNDLATRASGWSKSQDFISRRYPSQYSAIRVANAISLLPSELFQHEVDEDSALIHRVLTFQHEDDEDYSPTPIKPESDKARLERIYHRRF